MRMATISLPRRLLPVTGLVLLTARGSVAGQALSPVHHWVFDRDHVVGNAVRAVAGPDGKVLGEANLALGKGPGALVLDGETESVLLTDKSSTAGLPTKHLTAEAWVMIEKPLTWGGIVGAVRDNGSDETGWVLGYRDDKFSFAIATADKRSLTYLAGTTPFEPGKWYHVVGTYDGREHRVYVNGKLEASDGSRKGDLVYPPTDTYYEIGAYHDTNEYYRVTGLLHEVAVYDVALSAEQVAARYNAKRGRFPAEQHRPKPFRPKLGPYVQFDTPDSATVYWDTAEPSPSIVEHGLRGKLDQRVQEPTPKTTHSVRLTGLRHRAEHTYRVAVIREGVETPGRTHALDNKLNYAVAPIQGKWPYAENDPTRLFERAAEGILRRTGVTKGYCLVYGFGTGRLAYELARRSDLVIVGVEEDADNVARARQLLQRAGVYGSRITVRHVPSLAATPLTHHFANLVVSERMLAAGTCIGSAAEVHRVLRPGGLAYLGQPAGATNPLEQGALEQWLKAADLRYVLERGNVGLWAKVARGPLEGAGEWTHQYARPDNSAYGGEALGGVSRTDDLEVQWVGRPGADFGLDRNPRMPAPLSVNGRLFHQGLDRMIALDAYNGAVLWQLEIPDLRRVNMPRDASNWCADANRVFVAIRDKCWVLDAATGRRVRTCLLPESDETSGREWGYVARSGDLLYGSSVKEGAPYTNYWGGASWYDKPGAGSAKVCSDALFAYMADTGAPVWAYREGVIINTSIAIGGGRIYFVESRNAEVKALDTGRIGSEKLWVDQHLVALDAATGNKLWERPVDFADGTIVFYLGYSHEYVVVMSSTEGKYHLYTFAANSGEPRWRAEHDWMANNHSGHMMHPVLVGGMAYLEPCGYELSTGKLVTKKVGRREGCATYAGIDNALLYRGQSRRVSMWDRETETVSSWFNLRPSCWLSTIPAGGMVLSPEGGGGCSCGNWLETSLGFLPRRKGGAE